MIYQTSKTVPHGKFTIIINRPTLSKDEAAKRTRQVQTVLGSAANRKEQNHD